MTQPLVQAKQSKWVSWKNRNAIADIKSPGTYILAICDDDLSDENFSFISNIIYIGMTNSNTGLRGRLRQFDDTIRWKTGHGGAMRVRKKHGDYDKLVEKLYVSVRVFSCNPREESEDVLRTKGLVAQDEYNLWAHYFAKFDRLPEFNDKKKSKKALTKV